MKLPDWKILISDDGNFYHRKHGRIHQIITPDFFLFTTQRPDIPCLNEASAFVAADIFMMSIMEERRKLEESLED